MIRKSITDGQPERFETLRDAAEWYKSVVTMTPELAQDEREYTDALWGFLMQELADRQRVPAGFLSWMLQQLVMQEITLLETALEELDAATV